MDNRFSCGYVKAFAAGVTPDWREFVARMGFVQDKLQLNAVFLTAFSDVDGNWVVPFFAVEDSMGRYARVEEVIRQATPYEVGGLRKLDVAKVDLETLRTLSRLVPEPAPAVKVDEIMPGTTRLLPARPEDVFNGLVGMQTQRDMLVKLSCAVAKHGRAAIDCFHFVFAGAPGTGKTELARRLSSYLDLLGVTDGSGKLVKVGEAELVAKYVGHTAPKVKQAVESALGGVLFIDEFYAIANAPHFGLEAIDALVDQLDAHRHDFVCVVAGYPDEMDATFDLNPGLRDRFGYRIDFPDYDDAELAEIFTTMAMARGFAVEDGDVLGTCAKRLRQSKGFSNARTMRKLVDHAIVEASWVRDEAKICKADLLAATSQIFEDETRRRAGF